MTVFICHLSGVKKKATFARTCELEGLWRDAEDCSCCRGGGLAVIVVGCGTRSGCCCGRHWQGCVCVCVYFVVWIEKIKAVARENETKEKRITGYVLSSVE